MSPIENVSRRRFLTGGIIAAGALVLGVRYYHELSPGDKLPHDKNADHATLHPSVYLGIDPDGTVWIVAHRSEMGTTSRTTLPLVVADELDADWKRVKIEQALGDSRYGDQNTDGSHSIRSFYDTMREAGATARFMLIQAAAKQWGVPAAECETELRGPCERCGEFAGPQQRRTEIQTKECLAVCRQGGSELRPRSSRDRESDLWHGCSRGRHGVRVSGAPARSRRQSEIV